MSLPKRHKKLLTKEGFNELFERELSRFDNSHRYVFKQLWKESIIVYDCCLYDDYEAFLGNNPNEISRKELYQKLSAIAPSITEDTVHTKKGSVYIFADLDNGVCKIGFSTNVETRLNKAQRFYPSKLELICVFRDKDIPFEKSLHKRFKEYRLEREWFDIDGELEKFIKANRI